jgi:hypothetical protein
VGPMTRPHKPEGGGLAPGRSVHGVVVAHNPWGIELALEEAETFGTVDLRLLSDDAADMNEDRFPPLGVRLTARVQGMMPNGQIRLTLRASDLDSQADGRPS